MAEAAAADVIEDLLPLVDDLERALKADAGADGAEAYRTRRRADPSAARSRSCASAASRRSRRSAPTSIRTFTRPSRTSRPKGRRDGEVIEEFRRGYMLGDRLLRPSMVKVAKGER